VDLSGNSGKNRVKPFAIIIVLLSALFISSCDGLMTGDFKYFDSKSWGTWVSNDSGLKSGLTHKSINYWIFFWIKERNITM